MRTIIVIKEKEKGSLKIVNNLLERGETVVLVMMLDAIYLATETDENLMLKDMIDRGLKVLLLREEFEKRGLKNTTLPRIELIDYDGLIDLFFSENQKVLNL
jgi:sulfur relay protein TusB/DsrH